MRYFVLLAVALSSTDKAISSPLAGGFSGPKGRPSRRLSPLDMGSIAPFRTPAKKQNHEAAKGRKTTGIGTVGMRR